MGHRKGIKLVAYLPISKTTVLDIGSQHDQGAAEFLNLSKTHFLLRQGYFDDMNNPFNVDFHVFGKGLEYDSLFPGSPQVPIEGKITSVQVEVDNQLGLELSKLHLSASKLFKLWIATDPFFSIATLLKGDDTIIGANVPQGDRNLWGGKGDDLLWGRLGNDFLDGFKGNDVNDGGEGNDNLVDTKGDDTFQISTPFLLGSANFNFNFDTIKKLGGTDEIYLKYQYFDAAGMKVSKGELAFSDQAQDGNDFFLFFANVFSYDADANGPGEATPIFRTLNDAQLTHKMIELGISGDFY